MYDVEKFIPERQRRAPLTDCDLFIVGLWVGRQSGALKGALWEIEYEPSLDQIDADLMLALQIARSGYRVLLRKWGPTVNGELFDQYGDGDSAVPMPVIPFNL